MEENERYERAKQGVKELVRREEARAMNRWAVFLAVLSVVLAAGALVSADVVFGGGGPLFGLYNPELEDVNRFLIEEGFPAFEGPLFVLGGDGRGGMVGTMLAGGGGWGAWTELRVEGWEAELGVGFGGMDVGVAVGGTERSVLTMGALVGGGGWELTYLARPPETHGQVHPAIDIEPVALSVEGAFFAAQPYVDMQIQLLDWLGVALRFGYLWVPGSLTWASDGIASDLPEFNPSGPFLGLAVRFGGLGPEEPPGLADRLQSVVDRAVDRHRPGFPGALLHVVGPDVDDWSGAAGISDVQVETPMEIDSKFGIGSITKVFVATVTLQLAEEGVLSLDATLPDVLPEEVASRFANNESITVRMLLNHTSGIPEWIDEVVLDAIAADPSTVWDVGTLIDLATSQEPLFAPGEGWAYSNTDYTLLGMIIEGATGASWRDEVRTRVLEPLGLDSTFVRAPGDTAMPAGHAHGYADVAEELVDVTYADPSMAGAAGGNAMVSTAADLARFLDALLDGQLFRDPASLDAMLDFVDAPDEHGIPYWYGLGIEKYVMPGGVTVVGHAGGAVGYASVAYRAIDEGFTLVASGNVFDLGLAYSELMLPALEALLE